MGVSLTKGNNVSLTKAAPSMTAVIVGLGWDARTTDGAKFDLDASAIPVGADGKAVNGEMVFFNHLTSNDGSIEHSGDNLTGEGAGDDETIKASLVSASPAVAKIVVSATIYNAAALGLSFGQVRNAYIRILNADDNVELARYDLGEDASSEIGMVFGEVYRNGTDWKFRAVGQGYSDGLVGISRDYGVIV